MRPEVTPSAPHLPTAKPPGALRIVSLNTWKCDGDYPQRLRLIVDGLRALQPDIVLLQEVFRTLDGTWNTASTVANALKMQATCVWARRKPRSVQGQSQISDSGMAVLSAMPVQEHWPVRLPTVADDGERVAQLVRLDWEGEPLWLANLHLTHLPDAGALRLAQLRAALSHAALDSMGSATGGALWLIGDFNTALTIEAAWLKPPAPWSAQDTFAQFQMEHKITHIDAAGAGYNLDQCLHMWKTKPGNRSAVNAQLVLQFRDAATGLSPSDHAGLCVDLQ